MWKNLFMLFVALLGTFTIVYAFCDIHLNTIISYISKGTITGRINQMASVLTSETSGLHVRDRILTEVVYSGYPDEAVAFQLIKNQTFTDYGCLDVKTVKPKMAICVNEPQNAWLNDTTNDVGKRTACIQKRDLAVGVNGKQGAWTHLLYPPFVSPITIPSLLQNITAEIKADNDLLTFRNLTNAHTSFGSPPNITGRNHNLAVRDNLYYGTFAMTATYNFILDNVYITCNAEIGIVT
ncbi:MAG: hypothetical protein HFF01_06090 [Erysipelotrichaceae bacterium]|nr:hypothetical protein [Erysipelotrichaceae bacterium]